MTKKTDFIMAVQETSTNLAKLAPKFQVLFETYFDRSYNGEGIIQADIPTELGITVEDIAAFITLAENIGKFLNNQAIFASDYQVTLNKLRTDL